MFTDEGRTEFEKYEKWVSDEDFDLSPNFVPTEDTPEGAVEYYKFMMSDLVDFNAPGFTWPTGVGMNF